MKKRLCIILFLLIYVFSFAAKINNVDFKSNKFTINLSSSTKDDYIVSADEDTRLLYIEIFNLSSSTVDKYASVIENKLKGSNYFENITINKDKSNLSIILELAQKTSYSLNLEKSLIELILKKDSKNKYLVVIDPGHGGKDPGAVRGSTREKDIVLKVGKFLRDELIKDFNVIMTRNSDFFVELPDRPRMGNNKNAKLFVSIHANAALSSKANGVEVFYFSKKSSPYAERIANFENSFGEKYGKSSSHIAQISGELAYKKNQENSINLANSIVKNISENLRLKKGGIHGANFAVLRGFNGPGVLVELGFISNSYDRNIITNSSNQKKMAKQIADSIRLYFD